MIEFLLEQAHYAHFYAFGLLILAGCNIPISEDLVIIGSGVIAATLGKENMTLLIVLPYMGVYSGDIINYWIARLFGRKLLKIGFIGKRLTPERIEKVHGFMNRYGPVAILAGRFIPFGVRNWFFMTAGLSKMAFWKFAIPDFFASIATTAVLFSLGYSFGTNYIMLIEYLERWKYIIFACATAIVVIIVFFARLRSRKKENSA